MNKLELCKKTILGREAKDDELEICLWDKENEHKWTIASFDYNETYDCYNLSSYLDRLKDKNIDWEAFGELVQEGYKKLNTRRRTNE